MYMYTCVYNWAEGSEFACVIKKTWPAGPLKLDDPCDGGPEAMAEVTNGSNMPSKSASSG